MDPITFGVLTVSDTCYKDRSKDRSGPRLVSEIMQAFRNAQVIASVVPDENGLIQSELRQWINRKDVGIIFTTGGTGLAPRDVTPEATKPLLDKECPQLMMAITLASLKKTTFAALSRGVCGIAGDTLILNFPGSEKAVAECFATVKDLLPHALHLINDDVALVQRTHAQVQGTETVQAQIHVCPHQTGSGDGRDRYSPFPMLPVSVVMDIIFGVVQRRISLDNDIWKTTSPVNIPPFRASIKDGYAMKSTGFSGSKRVVGFIAAGDAPSAQPLQEDECFKINTGAPLPDQADCVVQVEDTLLVSRDKHGEESLVEIMVEPLAELDVRPIGHDLRIHDAIFPTADSSAVVIQSLLASVGISKSLPKPKVAVVSTGSELLSPGELPVPGKVYDSNATMLEELLLYFGFDCVRTVVVSDNLADTKASLVSLFEKVEFVISTGGVSMGDKDFIKTALEDLQFKIHCGRVNMKPGKPMTFASKENMYFFGLPGNPVSAFVTFHLFALPAIRWSAGWERTKCPLATIQVKLSQDLSLDPRPEYVRATVTSKNGQLYASVNGNQISSRLQSIAGADVLVHLPARTSECFKARAGESYPASVLRYDFISKYE
ncbi:molybdenum cofactor synthesis protein cinnamon [Drosophila obscura]|uniref:molybdenum cofactor synthesis protein cinnamon n=1 Tax=Drosophila obscura TaxID=7282 RepID=UPI001BB107F5|nr:molybdenum cofactor synthesis protein cinnamon [Drosophila obscura]